MELWRLAASSSVSICVQGMFETTVLLRNWLLECGSQAPTLRILGGSVANASEWTSVALAVSDGLQCTANLSELNYLLFVCNFVKLILFNWIVAPQWALASYSCIAGKSEFFNRRKDDVQWTLQVGNIGQQQFVPVETTLTYPQVH